MPTDTRRRHSSPCLENRRFNRLLGGYCRENRSLTRLLSGCYREHQLFAKLKNASKSYSKADVKHFRFSFYEAGRAFGRHAHQYARAVARRPPRPEDCNSLLAGNFLLSWCSPTVKSLAGSLAWLGRRVFVLDAKHRTESLFYFPPKRRNILSKLVPHIKPSLSSSLVWRNSKVNPGMTHFHA